MSYNLTVEARRISIQNGIALIEADGMKIDLSKCSSVAECHLALIGLATHCVTSKATSSILPPTQPSPGASEHQTADAVDALGETFREQQEHLRKQNDHLHEELAKQYDTITNQYASTAANLGLKSHDGGSSDE